tara:strand:- start:1030 stop:1755 length:726 start_codon:yes stop_codon:yes gene_type:complete
MITFKQHLSISKSASSVDDINTYLESLKPIERIDFLDAFEETYPIKQTEFVTSYIKDNFNFHDNVNDLVLGQFIMIEQIITGKIKFDNDSDMDLEIAKLLLRPLDHEIFDNEDIEVEKKNEKRILDSPVQDIYSLVTKYIKNREFLLFKQFSGVFYDAVEQEDTEDDDHIPVSPSADMVFNNQWYWYTIVRMLAQEDIRRYDEIYMLKMSVVLPEMSYLSQKNKIEGAQRRQDAALRSIKR